MIAGVYKAQIEFLKSPLALVLAKEFIKAKAKNQINFLKYHNKYHKNLSKNIEKMQNLLDKALKIAKTPNELMGHEGAISALYFDAIKIIIAQKYDFSARITKGQKTL